MRQITYHHGDPLNDAIRIEEANINEEQVAKSYQFLLRQGGLWQTRARLDFHDGDAKDGPKGLTEEAILAVVIDRLEKRHHLADKPSVRSCNDHAAWKLREALLWLREGRRTM